MISRELKACAIGIIEGFACISPLYAAGKANAGGTFGI
jgi:hypothetical protein